MPLMLPTVIRNFFGGYATRLYPFKDVREPFVRARGHIEFDENKCILCGNCARRCPAAAIEINKEKNELVFNAAHCIICEVCAEACNKDAIRVEPKWRAPFYSKPVEVHHPKGKEKAS
ncbi:MAG TPA: 4Fe-4S dicluster domain-containing protein [Syntrophomonadaceae bacterium]|nr:4Fe-4S dicluster domain-containing protein [Syntrophomonadaceae bacterium]